MGEYRLVWFQHLHKAAGTYVVRRAIANGEVLYPNNKNGNPCDAEGEIPLWEMSKKELSEFVDNCEELGVTFVATEWGAPDFSVLSEDHRVCLITCLRDPIKRFISNFNFDYYRMWDNSTNYDQYLNRRKEIYTSPEYYTRIFSRNHDPRDPVTREHADGARENLRLFDKVIVAETGMSALNDLGWYEESDTKHMTFGNRRKALLLLRKFRLWRLVQYIRRVKHVPPDEGKIRRLNIFDMGLYNSILD